MPLTDTIMYTFELFYMSTWEEWLQYIYINALFLKKSFLLLTNVFIYFTS